MRKGLISIIIIALVVIFVITVTQGLNIGNMRIEPVKQIVADNKELDTQITKLKNATESSYDAAILSLDSSLATLQDTKKRYNDATAFTSNEEINNANQAEQYDIGYLWTKIGLYATKNNVTIQLNVSYGTVDGLYNLSIQAYGQYLPISEFIYAIEKDTNLGFRIEDFSMTTYSEEQLQASFNIKNVAVNKNSLISAGALPEAVNKSNTNNKNTNTDDEANADNPSGTTDENVQDNQANKQNSRTGVVQDQDR